MALASPSRPQRDEKARLNDLSPSQGVGDAGQCGDQRAGSEAIQVRHGPPRPALAPVVAFAEVVQTSYAPGGNKGV